VNAVDARNVVLLGRKRWRRTRLNRKHLVRILIATKNFPPRTCGVGDYAFRLAETLAAAGEFVVVLTESADGPRHMAIGLREQSLGGWMDFKATLRHIRAASPDRLQLEYSGYAWGRLGVSWWLNAVLFKVRSQGIAVHIGLHESAISMRQHPLQIPVALAQWLHVGLLLAAAETVSLNMQSRVDILGRAFPWWRSKLRYRPNSSNIPVVPISDTEREAIRGTNGVKDGERVIATFGMFHTAKRYEAVIEAVSRCREKSLKLWMLGETDNAPAGYLARMRQTARTFGIDDRVCWPGRMEAVDISRMLQAADVFVLPQADGQVTRSGSFMAAAAHGLPVIAVRAANERDQSAFTHGGNVWFVEHATAEAFAAALDTLLDDAAAARGIGDSLRQLYKDRYDWPNVLESFGAKKAPAAGDTAGGRAISARVNSAANAAHAGGAKR